MKKQADSKYSYHAQMKAVVSEVIKLPQERLAEGIKQWDNSLVGWFIGEAPEFRLVAVAINKTWGKNGGVNIAKRGQLFIFQFSYSKAMQWVLDSGRSYIGRRLLIVQRWSFTLAGAT